ncbi:serine hydrolase domain-containing protein [Lentzea flava]|uniref:Serine hydrolase n=1 Tax=Lentzea flava TaxID=103732 RepID=A0ABQ2UHN8_9PSEU|nr:serine hydrolase domain-containing protein [Lentzea flava]MCP2199061.1 CubicO group peptidase, beta-lactamase class C family [Lentzea flava]GGU34776.1 serine hydrolase [Lentzea flava]
MTTTRRSVLGLLGATPLLLAAAPATASPLGPEGEFDRFLAERAARDEFSGTVLLTRCGQTVLARSYGKAREGVPNGPDTIFALASISKLFTAVALVQLVQQGKVAFHAQLSDHLAGFPAGITVHHLLSHSSGLAEYRQTPAFQEGSRAWSSVGEVWDGTLAIIRSLPAEFAPGSAFRYSSSGYEVLGAIVAEVSGLSYYDYVRRNVFTPAGMSTSDFFTRPQWQSDRRIARPYASRPSGRVDVVDQTTFVGSAAGNAFSTVRDMTRFARALTGAKLLNPAYTELVLGGKEPIGRWTDSPDIVPQAAFQAYGPLSLLLNDQWVHLHNGGAPGEGAYVEMYPDGDWVSVILSNYDPQFVAPVAARARKLITGGKSR